MEAWFGLLCLAQWKPSRINNKGQVMTLDAGQLMGALPFLADRWNWTVGTVRWYLNTLEREDMISRAPLNGVNHDRQNSRQPTNKCCVITIANYSKYQITSEPLGAHVLQAKPQPRNRRATAELQANDSNLTSETPQQGDKKEKSTCGEAAPEVVLSAEEIADQRFDEFWQAFPGNRRRNKGGKARHAQSVSRRDHRGGESRSRHRARICADARDVAEGRALGGPSWRSASVYSPVVGEAGESRRDDPLRVAD